MTSEQTPGSGAPSQEVGIFREDGEVVLEPSDPDALRTVFPRAIQVAAGSLARGEVVLVTSTKQGDIEVTQVTDHSDQSKTK